MTRILVTGKTGQLGWALEHRLAELGDIVAVDRRQMDLADPDSIRRIIQEARPAIIVNAAAYTAVDDAEAEPNLALQVNSIAPGVIAEEARRIGALLVHYSTDYVYDGAKGTPYVEDNAPNPLNTYGKSKLEGEQAITAVGCAHLILRTSWIYSGRGKNFVLTILKLARERKILAMVSDQIGSPTWAHMLADSTATILRNPDYARQNSGIYHLSAQGHPSRFDFAKRIIDYARPLSPNVMGWASLEQTITENYPLPALRPLNAATSKDKIKSVFGIEIPDWDLQLQTFLTRFLAKNSSR